MPLLPKMEEPLETESRPFLNIDNSIRMRIELNSIPISANASYRVYRNKLIKSKQMREYQQKTREHLKNMNISILEGDIKLYVEIHIKGKRKRDVDNMLKALIDSLQDVLFENDNQIVEINIKRLLDCPFDKTIIDIYN